MSTNLEDAPAVRAAYTNPGGPGLPDDAGLAHLLDRGLARDPGAVALSRPGPAGWEDRTWAQLSDDVTGAAARLLGRGIRPGDRLAILGRTSYAWAVADLAAALVGVVTVPIFPTSSAAQMRHILLDSGAVACLAEEGRAADVPGCAPAYSLDGLIDPASDPGGWADVRPAGADEVAAARAAVHATAVASIVYTSGTTGLPKGCVLTHRNLFAAAGAVVEHCTELFADRNGGQPATIVGLPLAHVFGRTVLQAGLYSGSRTALAPGIPEMVGQLATFEPTWLAVVPYALEKLRKGIVAAGGDGAGRHPLLGTALRHVICGGARLDAPIAEFFAGHGVTVLQAYGLTESATAVSINVPSTNRTETVGRPVPGTTVAIAEDGELLVRGRQVSPGYWPDPRQSPGGWLHTGDLAELEPDGFLRITGRRKEILVTTGGKNVAPVPLEDRLRLHPLVASAMVVAEGRPYVTALLVVDPAAVAVWAQRHSRHADPASLVADPELRAELGRAVDEANTLVSRAEAIRRFTVLTEDFTVAAGHLTPTLKMRRDVIEDAFRAQVEGLYP